MFGADDNFYSGHRGRLRQKFIDGKLADYELLELLLGYAIPRRDVRPLARGLLQKYGGIYQILTASRDELEKFPGIGHSTALFLKVIHNIVLVGYRKRLDERPIFHDENLLADYCRLLLNGKAVEEFHVIYLDSDMHILRDDTHSCGTSDWAAVYPREIVKCALEQNSTSVVIVHNHPISGRSFSHDDIEMTHEIQRLLNVFGIRLYDHFLVAGDVLYSARNMQLLK
ncbi:MAG: DNA repair protein RadC [Alphaproteobacteria bacterium]|nr:DNA repair protein RadC [Alphaproteobacteria bacterium]